MTVSVRVTVTGVMDASGARHVTVAPSPLENVPPALDFQSHG